MRRSVPLKWPICSNNYKAGADIKAGGLPKASFNMKTAVHFAAGKFLLIDIVTKAVASGWNRFSARFFFRMAGKQKAKKTVFAHRGNMDQFIFAQFFLNSGGFCRLSEKHFNPHPFPGSLNKKSLKILFFQELQNPVEVLLFFCLKIIPERIPFFFYAFQNRCDSEIFHF